MDAETISLIESHAKILFVSNSLNSSIYTPTPIYEGNETEPLQEPNEIYV